MSYDAPEPPINLRSVIEALEAANAKYVIVGGVALWLQGGNHITYDIDLAIASTTEGTAPVVVALSPHNPRPRDLPADLPFVWDVATLRNWKTATLRTDIGDIDLLGEISGAPSFDALYAESEIMELFGYEVHVASIPHLLSMKKAAGRDKDLRHILELESLWKVKQEETS